MRGTGSPVRDRKTLTGDSEAKQVKIDPEAGRTKKSVQGEKRKKSDKRAAHIVYETDGVKQMKHEHERIEEQDGKQAKRDDLRNEKRSKEEEEEGGRRVKMEEKRNEAEGEKRIKMADSHQDKKAEAEDEAGDNNDRIKASKLAEGHDVGTGCKVSLLDSSQEEPLLLPAQEKNTGQDLKNSTKWRTQSRNVCVLHSAFFREMVAVMTVGGMFTAVGCIYAFSGVALPQWDGIRTSLKLSVEEGRWIASIPILTSIPGMLISGLVAETLGCRVCLLIGCPILMATWVIIIFAQSFWLILLARIFQGLLLALVLVSVGAYTVEIGSTHHRGLLVATTEAMLMFGILFTYTLGIFMTPSSIAIVMVAQLLVVLWALRFIPNSPLWLLRKGRVSESRQALRYLRGESYTEEEANEMGASILQQQNEVKSLKTQLKLMKNKDVLKPISLCAGILLAKELTGQYVTVAYTVQIFQMAGSTNDPFWCSFYMGLMKFFPVFICWFLMERMPRRALLISGQVLGSAGMAIVGLFLVSPKLGVNPEVLNIYGWIPLFGVLVFTFAHMAGVSATSWALAVEIQPSSVRNLASGITNTFFGIFQFIIALTFPDLVRLVGTGGVFIFYAVGGLIGALFVAYCVPETKGRSLAQIQTQIMSKGNTEATPV